MLKTLLLLACTLLVLFTINSFSIRMFKLPKEKREKHRRIAVLIYAIMMVLVGIAYMFSDAQTPTLGVLYIAMGILFPIANMLDQIKNNSL